MSVDAFSGAVFVSLHLGETANRVCQRFLQGFASLGVPQEVKRDNGPACTAKRLTDLFFF